MFFCSPYSHIRTLYAHIRIHIRIHIHMHTQWATDTIPVEAWGHPVEVDPINLQEDLFAVRFVVSVCLFGWLAGWLTDCQVLCAE